MKLGSIEFDPGMESIGTRFNSDAGGGSGYEREYGHTALDKVIIAHKDEPRVEPNTAEMAALPSLSSDVSTGRYEDADHRPLGGWN